MATPKLPPRTKSGAPSEERMHWVKVPYDYVLGLYKSNVLKVERNFLRRAMKADYLTGSDLPVHSNFMAVRAPDGKLTLVDGYTRATVIEAGQKRRPEQVWLGLIDIDAPAETETIYDAVDSTRAAKRGRDAFDEGMRRAGLLNKVTSPMFVQGYAVSAILAAAGHRNVRKAVVEFKQAIEAIDPVDLHVGRSAMPAGALAGCLLLARYEKDSAAVQRFTAALARPDEVPDNRKAGVAGALKLHDWLASRRESGALSGKNVPVIMDAVLSHWLWQRHGAKGRPPTMSREEYLTAKT